MFLGMAVRNVTYYRTVIVNVCDKNIAMIYFDEWLKSFIMEIYKEALLDGLDEYITLEYVQKVLSRGNILRYFHEI